MLPPSYDDFLALGTADEQKQWLKNKNVQYWCYVKLSGPGGEEYHRHESQRVKGVYNRKKLEDEYGSGGVGSGSEIAVDHEADDNKTKK